MTSYSFRQTTPKNKKHINLPVILPVIYNNLPVCTMAEQDGASHAPPASTRIDSSLDNLFLAVGSETTSLSEGDLREYLTNFLDALGDREDVLLIPPDFTRFPSHAGLITQLISEFYKFTNPLRNSTDPPPEKVAKVKDGVVPAVQILPALGTHGPMTEVEIRKMFGESLAEKTPSPFLIHDWRNDVVTIGEAPASMVQAATRGLVDKPWPAQLNKLVWNKRESLRDPAKQAHPTLVLSIGQVVPHEVMGMANFNKNLFVGTGGVDAINLSHFIGMFPLSISHLD